MNVRNKNGVVFVAALSVMLLFSLITTSSMIVSVSESKMSMDQNRSTKAFYLSEAGLEFAKYEVKTNLTTYKNKAIDQTTTLSQKSLGEGTYDIDITLVAKNGNTYTFNISSVGTVGGRTRSTTEKITISMNPWGIFADYALYGGSGTMEIKSGVNVSGSIFMDGDMILKSGVTISDGEVYVTGDLTDQGANFTEGTLPNPLPTAPVLDDSYYNAEILTASTCGNFIVPADLAGGTVYVQGDVSMAVDSVINGPGILIVSGELTLNSGSEIGPDVVVIAGGDVTVNQGGAVYSDSTIYSGEDIQIKEGGTASERIAFLAPDGGVTLNQGNTFYGIIYADSVVDLRQGADIVGSIISGSGVVVKQGGNIVHDISQFPLTVPPGLVSEGEVEVESAGWEEM